MQEKIDLSIIIVALKTDYLYRCLDSLKPALKNINHEIIVVDNSIGSNIKYQGIRLIKNPKKSGFGENNNLGMRIAKGRYVLLLNDDTEIIDKNIFKEMIAWMDNHPRVGISSCSLVNPDRKSLQRSGGFYPTLLRVFFWMFFLDDIPIFSNLISSYHPNLQYFKSSHKQDWLTGAFFLMRKSAMNEVGFFDEDFFLYVEEVDLAYRFYNKGWEIWYLPKWKIIHHGMVSTGYENSIIMEMQNLKLFYKKHYSKWQLSILIIILKIGSLIRIPIFGKNYAKAFKSI